MNQMPKTYFVTLNWNTTDLLAKMVLSVEQSTPESHEWIIVDNGSMEGEQAKMCNLFDVVLPPNQPGDTAYQTEEWRCQSWLWIRRNDVPVYASFLPGNVGCVRGHNHAFRIAENLGGGEPHQIVMLDTDVEVTEPDWLSKAMAWADDHPDAGIIGFEHGPNVSCAPAVFLDKCGNWYLHESQMLRAEPVQGESVGLGFALIRWPVLEAMLRFDTGYEMYYKQDDDLCFQVRADLGLDVWVYPVSNVHAGSGSLRANGYRCGDASGWDEFDQIKQRNQAFFAKKWAWALRGRRKNMEEEARHLNEMRALMADRREQDDD